MMVRLIGKNLRKVGTTRTIANSTPTPTQRQDTSENQIQALKERIAFADMKVDKYNKKGKKDMSYAYENYKKVYENALQKALSGTKYNLSELRDYAFNVRVQAKSKFKSKSRSSSNKALPTGEITKIDYSKKTATIGGKTVRLTPEQLKGVKLSSVSKSQLNNVINKAQSGKTLSVQDFSIARQQGISSTQLLDVAKTQAKQERLKTQLQQELNKATSGSRPDTKALFNLGLSGNDVTSIVKAYETGQSLEASRNKNVDLIFNRLATKNIALDKTTQESAFKIAVNKELSNNLIQPLNFKEDITTFKKKYDELKELQKNYETPILKDMKKQINAKTYNIQQKALTGQSMTHKEIDTYINTKNFDINKEAQKTLKTILLSPYNYGKYINIRHNKGESNPLYNDVKDFLKGVKKTAIDDLYDMGVWALKGLEKGSKKAIKEAFNYGKRITKEAQKGNFVIDDDLKKISKLIFKGAKTTADKTKKLTLFVKKNPELSALIVGSAVYSGVAFIGATGSKITKLSIKSYNKNPAYFLGQVVGVLVPITEIKTGAQFISKLSPKYVKATGEVFKIKKSPFVSIDKFLKTKLPKVYKGFINNPEIILKKQTVKTGAKTLSEQTELAGQTVTAVNASADRLTSWLGRKKLIRKPFNLTRKEKQFPKGEASFPKEIKTLLNKFDNGDNLTVKEFSYINKWLQSNIAPNVTLLERSLYLDPDKGLRIKRLGIKKSRNATFKDILKGDFKLWEKAQKPQVLIFENAKIQSFPKRLKDVQKKLKQGKKLTEKETNRLIAWQVKTGSGKFKPIGSTIYQGGIELEVTLAPGEYIKRIKKVGFTYIDGKKVDFVTSEIYKPTKLDLKKIKKAQIGKLDPVELSKLEKDLSDKLGRKIKIETPKTKKLRRSRNLNSDVPILRVDGRYIRRLKLIKKLIKRKTSTRKRSTRKTSTGKRSIRKSSTGKRSKGKPSARKITPKKPSTGKPSTRKITPKKPRTPKPKIIKIIKTPILRLRLPPIAIESPKLNNKVIIFKAKYRERRNENKLYNKRTNPRVVKTVTKTTTKNRMYKYIADKVLNNLARSFKVEVIGLTKKKIKDISKPKELESFKISKGKNPLVLKFVQKKETLFKSLGEKREIKKLKALKKKKASSKKKVQVSKVTKKKKSSNTKRKKKTTKKSKKK